ncbi:bifunctional adenosylcobinamide kinase/adenosylcobinamide-phosphate guanylyltransferase [Singulisphaera acidiphila]|uniref:Adenosylcobinamide kinase n=1 Tax=Singulisphaera acidiphila (strain ATCC BAA-1392 / DSM 18658 / VKM B-2454 / MOB10) TaxID=886293 RepID=L0DA18_SINAD|nr:bifunctional adenosylcobinamide kinase/adenosylcobinamide-phosphate guanylyltransferase [Singulisphaera acidiphila]AGA25481.1 adenosyl cobinamide kinase/adenosyl cobinamide phosphate guanylyltransferase [Singulisphaera acidiphila DSM 18658]
MGESILVLGGIRSGKSRLAQRLAAEYPPVTYLATATVDRADPEMVARIERHQADRPESWTTQEVPRDLDVVLPAIVATEGSVVIDCVTLWISNLLLGLGNGAALADSEILDAVVRAVRAGRGQARVIWVSNEVGSSLVSTNALARRFADLQGMANQRLAEECDAVHLSVAGLSIRLK